MAHAFAASPEQASGRYLQLQQRFRCFAWRHCQTGDTRLRDLVYLILGEFQVRAWIAEGSPGRRHRCGASRGQAEAFRFATDGCEVRCGLLDLKQVLRDS